LNLSRLQKNFETLASEDPLWTVLSDNSKKGGKWDPEEFFQSGEDAVRGLQEELARRNIKMGGKRALDFGCGVGRLTFPLSRRFDVAIGIDISESMIAEANKNKHRGKTSKFILNTENSISFLESNTLDFAYSDIVFQHIRPRYSKTYFKEIARALRPGGAFVFQLPSHLKNGSRIRKRLSYRLKALSQLIGIGDAYFEMNAIPREKLVRYIERNTQLEHVAHWDHPVAGPSWQSYLYLFQKRSTDPT